DARWPSWTWSRAPSAWTSWRACWPATASPRPRGARPARCSAPRPEAPMIVPTRAEFATLAKGGKLVPIYRDVFADHDTPVSAFRKIDEPPYSFLLESVEGG